MEKGKQLKKIAGTVFEKYTKFSVQLSYTKRSICDPKDYLI